MTQLAGIDGDPDALDSRARALNYIAVSLGIAARDLRVVANADLVISDAVDAVRTEATQGAVDATDIYLRYAGTSVALASYSGELRRAKEAASSSILAQHDAESDVDYWVAKRAEYEDESRRPGEDVEHWRRMGQEAENEIEEARTRATAAVNRYQGLVDELDAAAQRAINQIENSIQVSGTNDNLIDKIEGAIRAFEKFKEDILVPILDAVREVCKIAADIIGIVGAFLVFTPFGAPLILLSKILSIVSIGASLLLFMMGARSFADLTKDAIEFAISVLVKFKGEAISRTIGANVGFTITGNAAGLTAKIAASFANGAIEVFEHVGHDIIGAGSDFVIDGIESTFLGPSTKVDMPAINPAPTPASTGIPDFGFRETSGELGQLYENIGNHQSVSGAR